MRAVLSFLVWPILTAALFVGACTTELTGPPPGFVASEWRWQYPELTAHDFHDVWGFADGQLFIVGEYGNVFHDGGSWSLEQMDLPTTADLEAVWGASPADVFAVGRDGAIVHYDGTSWTVAASPTGEHLRDIWGASPDAVFAAGDNGVFLRYDGSRWNEIPTGTHQSLQSVWASAPDDVYLIEGYRAILHYDGSTFTPVDTDTAEYFGLSAVWGRSASEVYAVGELGYVLAYDGRHWIGRRIGFDDLSDIWVTADSTVIIAGDKTLAVVRPDGTVADGSHLWEYGDWCRGVWSRGDLAAYAVGDNGMVCRIGPAADWELYGYNAGRGVDLTAVWGSSAGNVYAVGPGYRHFDGSRWGEWRSIPYTFHDAWGFGPGYALFVGSGGFMVEVTGPGTDRVWHFNDNLGLWGVWGTSRDDLYVVGERGKITRGRVGNESTPDSDNEQNLLDVHGSSLTDPAWLPEPFVVAVGVEGTILHNGQTWTTQASGTSQPLYGVWVYSDRAAFAVGGDGTIVQFDGVRWAPVQSGTTRALWCVWGTGPADVWAGGAAGTLLHFDGARWNAAEPVTEYGIRGIWGSGPGDVFAVGDRGMVLHYGD